ncbi:hypothetical protein M427DRAFT_155509 [Gonapodya prolifera JEL478]|uniref:L-threonate dehydrogenase n=1 Tax=Gonapodya prolifera (strain JEL478) TaxID=1344416 RepID=A0A139AE41_GONPJ|nr:hypothetical protein M427DRAFT_155509 [Gonapodya prolifera JEL478]|eukprot:KXS15061.1 hypothetical protein M427DRAFT_155509 [Gonapodya prolifera JEL478]
MLTSRPQMHAADLVVALLEGIHAASAAEAVRLAERCGLDVLLCYDIIAGAAGGSWMFTNFAPSMITGKSPSDTRTLGDALAKMDEVLAEAKRLSFPLFLGSAAHQLILSAISPSKSTSSEPISSLAKAWGTGTSSTTSVSTSASTHTSTNGTTPTPTPSRLPRVGFAGLGAMGLGMASTLVHKGFPVTGFDVWQPSLDKFVAAGGKGVKAPREAARDAEVFVVMVTNAKQADSVLFGDDGAIRALPDNATIIVCSTVPPDYIRSLAARVDGLGRGLKLVDAPVSGGVARAADGTLTIMAAGSPSAMASASSVLTALAARLYVIPGAAGAGSSVKMINQLLAGVHIAAAAESIAFAARLGLDTRAVYDAVNVSEGASWMFTNRVPHILDADWRPTSALDIFVKDLGIVLSEARIVEFPTFMSAAAHNLYIMGSAAGFGREDDSGVVRIWERMTGVSTASPKPTPASTSTAPGTYTPATPFTAFPSVPLSDVLAKLPAEYPTDPNPEIREMVASGSLPTLVVLDDDPTGTQTCHDINVLTSWSTTELQEELDTEKIGGFFVLTNSRAMVTGEAYDLTQEICRNLLEASEKSTKRSRGVSIVLRSDSTLRGHFPNEPDAVESVLGKADAWIVCPFFLAGLRYTIDNVHYVGNDQGILVPAGETEFARDRTFGYRASDLREWVEEKTAGRVSRESVVSVTIDDVRVGGPDRVRDVLLGAPKGGVVVVNAASDRDMAVFALGLLRAEEAGKRFILRTAASFVSARLGIQPKAPMTLSDLGVTEEERKKGGLIVVGSYVPKTTQQVSSLLERRSSHLHVETVSIFDLSNPSDDHIASYVSAVSSRLVSNIESGRDALVVTARELVTGATAEESLRINVKVSQGMVAIARGVLERVRPRYVIAKGGITSSDTATKSLGMRRAKVAGQAAPGIPLWVSEDPRTVQPGVPYVVFPGNVGTKDTLAEIVERWARD